MRETATLILSEREGVTRSGWNQKKTRWPSDKTIHPLIANMMTRYLVD